MKITLDINDDDIRVALQTAAESGIGYWARAEVAPDGSLVFFEHNDSRCFEDWSVCSLDIERGLRMMLHTGGGSGTAPGRGQRPEYWDANQANCFVQYAAFGELRYG